MTHLSSLGWSNRAKYNTVKENKIKKKISSYFIKGRGKECSNLCIGFAWQLQLSQTQHDALFHIPSLPRDVVDLTSRDPFLMSLCLQVWVSVKKMILHNDTKFCLRCMLKELKLRKAWQQLSDIDLNASADQRWSKCLLKLLPYCTVLNPVKFSGRTCLNVCAEGNCVERKAPPLPLWQEQLWTQLGQQTWVHSRNQCHQELLVQSRAHASKQGSVSWVPYALQDSACAKTTVNKNLQHGCQGCPNWSADMWDEAECWSFPPTCKFPTMQLKAVQTQVPCAAEQPQQHDDMTASFSFLILSQGSTTYNWTVALNPAIPGYQPGACDSIVKDGLLYVTSKVSEAGREGACIYFPAFWAGFPASLP